MASGQARGSREQEGKNVHVREASCELQRLQCAASRSIEMCDHQVLVLVLAQRGQGGDGLGGGGIACITSPWYSTFETPTCQTRSTCVLPQACAGPGDGMPSDADAADVLASKEAAVKQGVEDGKHQARHTHVLLRNRISSGEW